MRIRKLAKLHGFTFCNNNAVTKTDSISPPVSPSPAPFLQSHICHLNQSPWDVATFSPESPSSPFQVGGDESNAVSFVDSTGAVESVSSMSMNISVGGGDQMNSIEISNDYNRESLLPGKAAAMNPAAESSTAGRRIAISQQVTKDSYDFYYYSGFGPRWGKRRGSRKENGKSIGIMETEVEGDVIAAGEKGIDREQLDYVELDEDDDDYNEDDRESGGGVKMKMKKKRGRKPIKARSLKSLM